MLEPFRQNLDAICPGWEDRRFIVAFSGGLDSTALLRLMSMSLPGRQLAAAHLNHLIRPEAAGDQNFAAQTCQELGLNFITESVDVPLLAQSRRRGLEEAARFARYEFFQRAVQSWPADFVVTAHQADDQAETILMHLIKGAGGGGLAGIHPRRPLKISDESGLEAEILRPLLPFSRAQLEAWLTEHSFSWVNDASNNDDHYLRNTIRLDILPKLKELNPRVLDALSRSSAIMRDEEEFWQIHLAVLWRAMVDEPVNENHRLLINRQKLEALTTAEKRRLIYQAFLRVRTYRPGGLPEPLSLAGIDTVLTMLARNRHRGLDLPGGLRAELEPQRLIISLASRFR